MMDDGTLQVCNQGVNFPVVGPFMLCALVARCGEDADWGKSGSSCEASLSSPFQEPRWEHGVCTPK